MKMPINQAQKLAEDLTASLRAKGYIPEEDVAWVAVNSSILCELPGEAFLCPIRGIKCKKFEGMEFRESDFAGKDVVDLSGWFAWNITKRTKDLFKYK